MKDGKYYLGIILNIVIPLAEIGLVCVLGPKLLVFFMPFVIGWIIALIANPLVRMLERRLKLVRKHSSALIVVAVLAAGNWADVFSDFQTVVSGLRSGEEFAGIVCSGSHRGAECICPV